VNITTIFLAGYHGKSNFGCGSESEILATPSGSSPRA
jgi:hypothetical protein